MLVERRMIALRLRRGDWVCVRGRWHEVVAVRAHRYAAGGLVLVLVFNRAPAVRVYGADMMVVKR
ncbi:hypothetical protein J7E91_32095 [Streptomyces sp. ISL-99]|uniref:hypothetical protein n=1 Tax=Streptomyces sp. ISL-99 TaxID=2819193 RepID=UPI001BE551A4|nr:hypothetical protein [Streptomyces sp. ISL-99]MBT2529881.1 hypothetical protein [Streptomyces sp. ISL-99]